MPKVEVIEVEATKLDPNAVHLIVFNSFMLTKQSMDRIVAGLDELGVRAVYAHAQHPETALKVYQIPTSPLLDGEKTR